MMNNEAMGEAMNVDEQQDNFAILPPEMRAMIFKYFNDADLENISTLSKTFDQYVNEEREHRYKDRKLVVRPDSNLSDLRVAFGTISKSSRTITAIKWATGNDRFVSAERKDLLRNAIAKHFKTIEEIEIISSSIFGNSSDIPLAFEISDLPVLKRLKVRFELNHSASMNHPWNFLRGIVQSDSIEELELDFDAPNCDRPHEAWYVNRSITSLKLTTRDRTFKFHYLLACLKSLKTFEVLIGDRGHKCYTYKAIRSVEMNKLQVTHLKIDNYAHLPPLQIETLESLEITANPFIETGKLKAFLKKNDQLESLTVDCLFDTIDEATVADIVASNVPKVILKGSSMNILDICQKLLVYLEIRNFSLEVAIQYCEDERIIRTRTLEEDARLLVCAFIDNYGDEEGTFDAYMAKFYDD